MRFRAIASGLGRIVGKQLGLFGTLLQPCCLPIRAVQGTLTSVVNLELFTPLFSFTYLFKHKFLPKDTTLHLFPVDDKSGALTKPCITWIRTLA